MCTVCRTCVYLFKPVLLTLFLLNRKDVLFIPLLFLHYLCIGGGRRLLKRRDDDDESSAGPSLEQINKTSLLEGQVRFGRIHYSRSSYRCLAIPVDHFNWLRKRRRLMEGVTEAEMINAAWMLRL